MRKPRVGERVEWWTGKRDSLGLIVGKPNVHTGVVTERLAGEDFLTVQDEKSKEKVELHPFEIMGILGRAK